MVLGNCQYQGVLLIWIMVGQGSTVLAVDVDGECFDFVFIPVFFLLIFGRQLSID